MNLLKAIGTIGGLTMISRVLGFARDMLASRILGAGMAADAFFVAFRLPNLFRRLFGEGAFSAGFVPLFSQRLHGPGGIDAARRFSEEVLSVFLPVLFLFTILFEIIMPGFVWLMASGYADEPAKFDLTVSLTRITFPYLLLISLVSLLSGVLNSMSKFAAAAFAPALLNVAMVGALLLFPQGGVLTARMLAIGVTIGGGLQLALLWYAARRAGISLKLRRPRFSPEVKELVRIILPATFGAGIYQLSQFIDTFFATRLPEGSMAYLNYADRLNQLPLSVIGTALGTAILPLLSRHISTGHDGEASKVQGQAVELSMLLTLPAALALGVTSTAIVTAFFQGGRFTAEDAATTGMTLGILVGGLPAYVLIKVLTPGFYSRKDTRTPVKTAMIVLVANIALNFALIPFFGIYGLAFATAACSWLNCAMLYAILHRRGHFRIERSLWNRLSRQLVAAGAMAATLVWLQTLTGGMFAGSVGERLIGVGALVGIGMAVYFGVAWVIGGMNRDDIKLLLNRRRKAV
jgi:putative peptidoglycan lipid II flippase